MKSSLCTPTCHHNQLNFSLAFLLTIFQNIPCSLMPTWSHGCNQAHNHTLYPTSAVGISPMEDLAEVQVGAGLNPFSPASPLTDRNGRILSLRSLSTLAQERTTTSREGN